jgi:hypothetical protein
LGAVFVQEVDDLRFLLENTAVTHGDDDALLVARLHHSLIGPDPGEVRDQLRAPDPGDGRAQAPVRDLKDRLPSHPRLDF